MLEEVGRLIVSVIGHLEKIASHSRGDSRPRRPREGKTVGCKVKLLSAGYIGHQLLILEELVDLLPWEGLFF